MSVSVFWAAQAALFTAAVGTCVIVWLWLRASRRPKSAAGQARAKGTPFLCTVCQREIPFHRDGLVALSMAERALAVRTKPKLVGRPLAELVCAHCEAAHCFAVDRRPPEWVGVNLYEPQQTTAHCFECGRLLRKPDWAPGTYDGRLNEAPSLPADYGLVCNRCQAVNCVECCRKVTRRRTPDGSFLCPRCNRGPVDRIFHF